MCTRTRTSNNNSYSDFYPGPLNVHSQDVLGQVANDRENPFKKLHHRNQQKARVGKHPLLFLFAKRNPELHLQVKSLCFISNCYHGLEINYIIDFPPVRSFSKQSPTQGRHTFNVTQI